MPLRVLLRKIKLKEKMLANCSLTADKKEIKDFPKFAYRRTSFIRYMVCMGQVDVKW